MGYIACIAVRNAYKFWFGSLRGREHLEYLGVNGRIVLECVSESGVYVDLFQLAGEREFLDHLSDSHLKVGLK